LGGPFLCRSAAVKSYHIDNEVNGRIFDVIISRRSRKPGMCMVCPEASVLLHATDELKYPSHPYLSGRHWCFSSRVEDIQQGGIRKRLEENAKGVVRYLDPERVGWFIDDEYMLRINKLDQSGL